MSIKKVHPLRQWRESAGISAYYISNLLGVHASFISNIEAFRRPMSDDFMQKLASIPEFNLEYRRIRSWQLITEYSREEIEAALEHLEKFKDW